MGGYRLQINEFEVAAGMLSVDNWELIRPHFFMENPMQKKLN